MSETTPFGWMKTTLGAVTREINARVGDKGKVRVLSSTKHRGLVPSDEYFKNRIIYSSDTSNYKLVRRGEFAYATNHLAEGSIGYQDGFAEACVSPIYTVFSCDKNVYGPYLFKLLKSPRLLAQYKLHEQASVDRRGAIRYSDFSKISILLPPLSEQIRVVEVFDFLGDALGMASDIIDKHRNIRSGVLGGLFDEEGAYLRVGEVGKVSSGGTPSRELSERYYVHDGVPWVKTLDLNEGVIRATDESITHVAVDESSCSVLPVRSVLVAMYGGWAQIGRTGILGVPATINQALSGIIVGRDDVIPEYLLIALQAFRFKWKSVGASTRKDPNLTRSDVLDFQILFPDVDVQNKFVSIVRAHDERIAAEKARLEKLRKLKAGLMDDLLTGRVRVNQLDELPV